MSKRSHYRSSSRTSVLPLPDDIVFASSVASTYLKQGYELLQNFFILEQLYDSSSPRERNIDFQEFRSYTLSPSLADIFPQRAMLSIRFIQDLHSLQGHALASFVQL